MVVFRKFYIFFKNPTLRSFRPAVVLMMLFLGTFNLFSETLPEEPQPAQNGPLKPVKPQRRKTSPITQWPEEIPVDSANIVAVEGEAVFLQGDSLNVESTTVAEVEKQGFVFNPDPTRAVWMSALLPGLGQLYNRRYWKLPIVIGGFMGLGYATGWNNTMLRDYSRAYADLKDNDPSTKSYMDFFPPTTKEEDINKTWLESLLKSRKDFYRRNRDLCIIGLVAVYLLAIIDAYVDASMSHFDISPDLAVNLGPAVIPDERNKLPGVGIHWALTFR